MSKSKGFWYFLMMCALGLYLLGFALWFLSPLPWLGAGIVLGVFLLHICELKTAMRIGRKNALSDTRIRIMTLVFGFTWWVPLRSGVIKA